MSVVRTRFAPSPTGFLHIGGARTALFSWLQARRHGGVFVLRVEDTDRQRSTEASVNAILEGMTWLGLEYDEGPFFQTRRFDRYREVTERLLREDKAYRCYCSREELDEMREQQMQRGDKPRYDGRCRHREQPREGIDPVIRFKNPLHGEVVIEDRVKGRVVISNQELDDLIIVRSDGTPTYNFTVVVDDMDMGITHVIRGDDHVNNTPRQINILQALGARLPVYGHVPMILGEDGRRLSKRHGAMGVMEYRQMGFLPEAVLNYLVRLGWSHGDQEIFSLEQMVELFDIDDVNRAASTFNTGKLLWLNHQYIMNSDPVHVARHLSWHMGQAGLDPDQGPALPDLVRAQAERSPTLVDMVEKSHYFYRDFEHYDEKAARKNLRGDAARVLARLRESLAILAVWQRDVLHQVVVDVTAELELKMGKVAQPLRVAVAGGPISPSIEVTLELLGRERTLARVDRAIAWISANEAAAPG